MKRPPLQQSFLGKAFEKPGDKFGGSLLKGNAKTKRPLESKLPVHLVLRTGKGVLRLPKTFKIVNELVNNTAKKHGVKVYQYANAGNHLHLLIKIPHVSAWAAFIRELTGRIAQEMLEFVNLNTDEKFWLFRPFTRIVRSWRRAYQSAKDYVYLNQLEADGHISRKEIKNLNQLRMIWSDA